MLQFTYLSEQFWEKLDICIGLQKTEIRFMIGFETRALGKPRGGKSLVWGNPWAVGPVSTFFGRKPYL